MEGRPPFNICLLILIPPGARDKNKEEEVPTQGKKTSSSSSDQLLSFLFFTFGEILCVAFFFLHVNVGAKKTF